VITFEKKDRDAVQGYKKPKPWRKVQRTGLLYAVAGETVELFPLRVMAEALDRSSATLVKWETLGKFPKPLFSRSDNPKAPKRWYSATQVLNLHRLFRFKYGGLKFLNVDAYHGPTPERMEQFINDVRRVFYMRALVLDEKGEWIRYDSSHVVPG
jgi:hypothetical protein